jgi:hypothetical protein
MMRLFATPVSVLAVAFTVTGCFPMRFTVRPGANGTVVDSQTHAPVAGAEVFFSRSSYTFYHFPPQPPEIGPAVSNATPPFVFTDASGRFTIPPRKKWGVYIVPMDVFVAPATLVVRRDGYAPELLLVNSRSTVDLNVAITKSQ